MKCYACSLDHDLKATKCRKCGRRLIRTRVMEQGDRSNIAKDKTNNNHTLECAGR
jgi:ribosomal protein L40E